MDVATLVERHFRIPFGLSGVGARNVFEQGSTSRRRKTRLDDMPGSSQQTPFYGVPQHVYRGRLLCHRYGFIYGSKLWPEMV